MGVLRNPRDSSVYGSCRVSGRVQSYIGLFPLSVGCFVEEEWDVCMRTRPGAHELLE